jgi:cell division protein FtsI (penicillin-binding protein 3)
VFPLDQPRYAMMILVDNPHTEPGQGGHTAGWNAGVATGRIVARVAPMLGITPNFDPMLDSNLVPPELR